MIQALRSHHVNTLVELRRIERAFALLGSPDVTEPMTAACEFFFILPSQGVIYVTNEPLGSYYVNSHSLLTEMRALTKNYPFR